MEGRGLPARVCGFAGAADEEGCGAWRGGRAEVDGGFGVLSTGVAGAGTGAVAIAVDGAGCAGAFRSGA